MSPASESGIQPLPPLSMAYQHLRRKVVFAVVMFLILLLFFYFISQLVYYPALEYATVFLLMVLSVLLAFLFLRQYRKLEEVNHLLEQQQSEISSKAELLDSASDAILLLDANGRLVYFNNALCAMTGHSRQELQSSLIQDIEPPEYAEKVTENIQRLFTSGSDAVFESAYLHVGGATIPVEVNARPVIVDEKQLVLSVVRDIRERKDANKRLINIAREWQETFNSVADVVWLLDMDRKIIRANMATNTVFGLSSQQVLGVPCCKIVHGDGGSHEECPFEQMKTDGKRATTQFRLGTRWFEVTIDPVFDESRTVINAVHVVKDITGLKSSELREHIRSEMLERIARGETLSNLLTFICSAIESELPGALCSILLVSEDGKRLMNGAAPSLPDIYNIAVHRTKIGEGIGSCGTAAFRKKRVVVEDIATHPFWKGFTPAEEAGLRSCWSEPIMSSSGKLLGTFAIYHHKPTEPGDNEIRLIEMASAFAGIAIERNRSETERSKLEEQLHQSQKMEAIGHLAGGMAHDFNNLLTPIIVYADMLKKTISKEDEKAYSKLELIVSASHKARDLTSQLLGFGRKQIMQTKAADLNDVVRSFHPMIRRTLRENIDIQLKISQQPQVIMADRPKLEQVILNLAINAKDAIESNGTIIIETGQVLIDNEYARLHPGLSAGSYVMLSISDNGCGMSEQVMKHIFEPFFSTKGTDKGSGLGLANVYGIVKQHDGYIEVRSAVGTGTTFRIYLPIANEAPTLLEPVSSEEPSIHGGSETILLVEDNDMVREMVTEMLHELGYTVHVAAHPDQALEIARQLKGKLDLLISDVVMPGMDGRQLFHKLKEEHTEITTILYMSGYTKNIISGFALEPGEHFIAKPFTPDAFMAKIRELLS